MKPPELWPLNAPIRTVFASLRPIVVRRPRLLELGHQPQERQFDVVVPRRLLDELSSLVVVRLLCDFLRHFQRIERHFPAVSAGNRLLGVRFLAVAVAASDVGRPQLVVQREVRERRPSSTRKPVEASHLEVALGVLAEPVVRRLRRHREVEAEFVQLADDCLGHRRPVGPPGGRVVLSTEFVAIVIRPRATLLGVSGVFEELSGFVCLFRLGTVGFEVVVPVAEPRFLVFRRDTTRNRCHELRPRPGVVHERLSVDDVRDRLPDGPLSKLRVVVVEDDAVSPLSGYVDFHDVLREFLGNLRRREQARRRIDLRPRHERLMLGGVSAVALDEVRAEVDVVRVVELGVPLELERLLVFADERHRSAGDRVFPRPPQELRFGLIEPLLVGFFLRVDEEVREFELDNLWIGRPGQHQLGLLFTKDFEVVEVAPEGATGLFRQL